MPGFSYISDKCLGFKRPGVRFCLFCVFW